MNFQDAGYAVDPFLDWNSANGAKFRNFAPGVFLFICCFVLWVLPAGLSDLRGADETRYVLVAREWLAGDRVIGLTLFGVPYDQKPPLPFLLLALMLKMSGGEISSLAVRLPSILLGTSAVLATWAIGRRHLGEIAGFFAAIILMTSTQWMMDTPTAELNVMFAGWLTLSLAVWFLRPIGGMSPRRALAMWLLLAAAFFTKGPLALLIVTSVISAEAAIRRSWAPFKESRFAAGMLLNIALIGVWLYAQHLEAGSEFVKNQVSGETVDRFLKGSHEAPFYFYMIRLFTSIMFPWAFFLVPAANRIWKEVRTLPTVLGTALFGWGLVPLLILTLAAGKRESYPIPVLPGLSLLVGHYLSRLVAANKSGTHISLALMGVAIIGSLGLAAGTAAIIASPELGWTRDAYFTGWQMLPAIILIIAFGMLARSIHRFRNNSATPIFALAAIIALSGLCMTSLVRPANSPGNSSRSFSAFLDDFLARQGTAPVVGLIDRAARPEYHVYGGYAGVELDYENDICVESAPLPDVLLLRTKDFRKNEGLDAVMQSRGYSVATRAVASRDVVSIYCKEPPHCTNAVSKSELRFGLVGDTGRDSETVLAVAKQMFKSHKLQRLDAVMLLGDNIYGDDEFDVAVVERFEKVFKDLLTARVPFHAALGNHDVSNGYVYREQTYAPLGMDGQRYYEKTFGDDLVTFFVLDDYSLLTSPEQYIWLKNRLEACQSTWRFIVTHEPLRTQTDVHSIDQNVQQLLGGILKDEGVQAVFSGHLHFYERPQFQHPLQVTLGSGSKAQVQTGDATTPEATLFSSKGAFALLTISPDRAVCKVIAEDGSSIEKFSIPHESSPPAFLP